MCERVDLGGGNFAIACGGHRTSRKPKPAVIFPATCLALEAAGWRLTYTRPCKRCHTVLEFWLTPAKKWAPLERVVKDGTPLRVSHFETCPNADEFRRKDSQLDLFGAT